MPDEEESKPKAKRVYRRRASTAKPKAKTKPKAKPKNPKIAAGSKGNKNALGNSGGRPTKYKPEFVDELLEFFSLEDNSYEKVTNKQGTVQMVPRTMPTLERFAFSIGVCRSTLHEWANATKGDTDALSHPEFSYAYACARDWQMAFILEAGVAGALNAPFLGLFMKNHHGWADKVEQETVHKGSIDMSEIDKDLAAAAEAEAENYQKLLDSGVAGKFNT